MNNNPLELENYVTVTKNNSSTFSPSDIVSICKRINNPKRDFLFVNHLQGKHICVEPMKTFKLYQELVFQILEAINDDEKIVVIGFAETATAIGHYIASSLSNCIYYMQTTRENIPNAKSLLEFEEEHSHATEQFLYGDASVLSKCDRIIFVDDEISTGNTVLNFIHQIEKINVKVKYGVASLLNWQNDEWEERFNELNIDTYFVLKGKLKDINAKVSIPISYSLSEDSNKQKVPIGLPTIFEVESKTSNYFKERTGSIPNNIFEFAEDVYSDVVPVIDKYLPKEGENILVLGTEEYMFTPMVIANVFAYRHKCNVKFHATTRSPIETSVLTNYAIKRRYPIASCYDASRKTYIYNLKSYDKVYIITDVVPTDEFVSDIYLALLKAGCNSRSIFIVIMKG